MKVHKIVIETSGAPRINAFVGGRSVFPDPQLGTRCVCCDAPGRPVAYDPAGDRQRADAIKMPVCDACTAHVARGHRLEVFLGGMTGGLGLMMLFFAAVLGSSTLALVGVAMVLAVVAWLGIDRDRKNQSARRGHHRDFLIGVGAGFCVVRTTNPRLAEELLARPGARALTRS